SHVALSLDPTGAHHAIWTLIALAFVGSVAAAQTDWAPVLRVPVAYRKSFLLFALQIFRMVVICSAISQITQPEGSIFAISCFFRNAVVYFWARRGLMKVSGYRSANALWSTKWLFDRPMFAAVTGFFMLASGPSALLHLLNGTIASQAWLLHNR